MRAIFCDVLGVDESLVVMEADFRATLEGDSLDAVELAIEMEERLEISIPDDYDFDRLKTFGDWMRVAENPPRASEVTE